MSNNVIIQKPKKTFFVLFFLIFLCSGFISVASAQILICYDNMTSFPLGWSTGGTGGPWIRVENRYMTSPSSAKCTPLLNYDNNQDNWMQRNVDLTGYVNASVSFQIWQNTLSNDYIYFEYYSGGSWVTHWSRAGNYSSFSQQVLLNIPNTATALRFRFASDSSGTAEGVYIDDFYVWGYRYDVGCTQIIAPVGMVDSGQTVTPRAVVENFGDFITTFWVRMKIGSYYNISAQVVNLAPGTNTTVTFPNWTALERGNLMVRCTTQHPNDIYPTNDRKLDSVYVRVIDVGTEAIVSPVGIVDSGQSITPQALIKNYGTETETFNVYYRIDGGYSSSRTVTLNPGVAETTSFNSYLASTRGIQATSCSTALASDPLLTNNQNADSFSVRVKDVGVAIILTPAYLIDSTTTRTPYVRIRNYGTHQENLNVQFRIQGPGVNWSSTVPVTNLNPNELRLVSFNPWTVGTRGNYTSRCSTGLVGDQINNNNTLDTTFIVRVRDAGVVSISSPPAIVDSSTSVPISATVANYGTSTETFLVRFWISSYYMNTRTITLGPSGITVVNFDDWVVNAPRNNYIPGCSTELVNDANSSNNRQTSNVTVNVHDVGVAFILAPSIQVDSTARSAVIARVTNYGTYSENFSALFHIGSFYTSNRTLNLAAGSFNDVAFDSWTITQPRGGYTGICSTSSNLDANPNNNSRTRIITVMVHDVGVVSINSPPAQVDTNNTEPVSATIRNFGTYTESFNVIFKIGGFYSSTQSVNLSPNTSQNVAFANWSVNQPRGSYALQCSTQLSTDIIPLNNYQNGSVTVNVHDVGVVAFSGLSTQVDSGVLTPIAATVTNYGTTSEIFDVNCKIGTFYNCTRTVNLTSGNTTLVEFDTLLPLVRNNNSIKCSTQLNTDLRHDNDYQDDSIFVEVRDISAQAILIPTGIIQQNEIIIPQARFENLGNMPATFPASFRILFRSNVQYYDEMTISLNPGSDSLLEFQTWLPESLGSHITEIQCALVNDMNSTNDLLVDTISVMTDFVWHQKSDLPEGPGKKVKKGSALVYVQPSWIYAFKGSNTNQFYRYTIETDTWAPVCTIPYSELTRRKRVKSGSALCYNGSEYIYALKGANTSEFWRYHILSDSWTELTSLPLGSRGKKSKGGSGLVYLSKDGLDYVYCLKGSNTDEFYAYCVETDSWLTLSPAPLLPSNRGFNKGSQLVFDGTNSIYALKSKYNEFYIYDVAADSWAIKPMLPFYGTMDRKKKVKDGSGLAYDGSNLIYALKGGKTDEFWAYDLIADSWLTKEPVPLGSNSKYVKSGGALCWANSVQRAFIFKGANTQEFWMYIPNLSALAGINNSPSGVMSSDEDIPISSFSLNIAPNPFAKNATVKYHLPANENIILKLFDACGKLVQTVKASSNTPNGSFILNGEKLPVGIYILRLETNKNILTKKVVISR